jgi:Glycerol-3-phosphate acyltransferase
MATIYVGHLAGVVAGGAAMLGHWRPLFLRFARGGKVVATTGGAFLGVAPVVGGIGAAVWIVVFAAFRYASLASIVAAGSLPLIALGSGSPGLSSRSPYSPHSRCSSCIGPTSAVCGRDGEALSLSADRGADPSRCLTPKGPALRRRFAGKMAVT